MSAFALSDGVVYHTYSAYARGLDALWGMYAVARPGAEHGNEPNRRQLLCPWALDPANTTLAIYYRIGRQFRL